MNDGKTKPKGAQLKDQAFKELEERNRRLEAELASARSKIVQQPQTFQKVPADLCQTIIDMLANTPTGQFTWMQVRNVTDALMRTEQIVEGSSKTPAVEGPDPNYGEESSLEVREVRDEEAKETQAA